MQLNAASVMAGLHRQVVDLIVITDSEFNVWSTEKLGYFVLSSTVLLIDEFFYLSGLCVRDSDDARYRRR